MRKILIFLPLLLLFYSCDAILGERTLKPYNPQKAGATIVESYNITGQIKIGGTHGNSDNKLYYYKYGVAEYNNVIYIINYGRIYIFEKDTFNKIREISIKMPLPGLSSTETCKHLAITSGSNALLFYNFVNDSYFYSLDLMTGDTVLISKLNDGVFTDVSNITAMGYNKADDTIWFQVRQEYEFSYCFFKYDVDEKALVFIEQKDGHYKYGYNNITIHGDILWLCGYTRYNINDMKNIGIYKYSFENPEEELHFINVEYLNTLTLPQSPHYDGEHIYLMVERNNQIQMLKLLPHG
jgi:hypothetical protein